MDVSAEIKGIFALDATNVTPFCLVLVDMAELGGDEAVLSGTAAEVLTAAELAVFKGFRFSHRRREWLAGRVAVKEAVRTLLAKQERPLSDIEVGVEGRGKPFVRSAPDRHGSVHIAISHSGGVALGLASLALCALDFQEIRSSLARVEPRFVRKQEKNLVLQCHADTLTALGLLWAGKEALRKYVDLWPLLGFLEAGLVEVSGQGAGFSLVFEAIAAKRQLPMTLPPVLATAYREKALAIIIAAGEDGHG